MIIRDLNSRLNSLAEAIARKLALQDDIWIIIISRKKTDSQAAEQKFKAEGTEVELIELINSCQETKWIYHVKSPRELKQLVNEQCKMDAYTDINKSLYVTIIYKTK